MARQVHAHAMLGHEVGRQALSAARNILMAPPSSTEAPTVIDDHEALVERLRARAKALPPDPDTRPSLRVVEDEPEPTPEPEPT